MTLRKYVYIVPGISLFLSCLSFSPSSVSLHLFIPVSLSQTQNQASCRCLDAHFCLHQPLLLHPFHPPPSLSRFPVYQAAVQVHVQQNSVSVSVWTGGCRFTTEF